VALLTLPFHGARTPPTARFSGEHFARPDVRTLNDAVRRALYEILLTARWLRDETPGPVGLLGLSLGGYLAATAATLDPELAFVIPIVPPVCFGDLAWRFAARTRAGAVSEHSPLTYDELRIAYRAHSPLTYDLRVPRERVLIIAGRGDRIVPREHPTALWRHWGEPAIHWFSGSHLAPFGRGGIVSAVGGHLSRLAVLA
jgi:dipeptidyl aminopeptidase/acylaminoacyl peptidase